jgi:steroid 5-alpha reductase family enzyme
LDWHHFIRNNAQYPARLDDETNLMAIIELYAKAGLVIFGLMTTLWVVSLFLKNSSIVDIFWGTGFVILAWVYFALTPGGFITRKLLLACLTTLWGLKLSLYILYRNWGKPEDFRYQKMRQESGNRWWWKSYFQVFMLQGLLMWLISIPLLAAQTHLLPDRLTILDILGVALWGIGFFFETAGDLQLARFKSNPANKGKVMDHGVWQFTRHPNYFGDATQWWGYFLIATAAGGWWTIFSPVFMTTLLMRVSGVTLLEKTLETRPGYKDYFERTSAFIPWFPRRKS